MEILVNPVPTENVGSRPRPVGSYMRLSLTRDTGVIWRSYYFAGGARIAMREDSDQGSEVFYILSDHLGSTSKVVQVDAVQDTVSITAQQWYKPWGEERNVTGQSPTDYTFQGQRDPGWGLTHFGARWFDSYLNLASEYTYLLIYSNQCPPRTDLMARWRVFLVLICPNTRG